MSGQNEIVSFAETNYRNQRQTFGIKIADRRKHVYIIGKTGMGKTTLLENMAVQDIQAGRGLAVVDPHGEFAEKMLDFVPPERINDVVYFNPADLDFPIAFNVIEKVDLEYRHLVASGIMGVFEKIWPDVWSARMEYILNNAIMALLEYPGATLLGINRMLADKDYRKKVVDRLTDPAVKSFWINEFAKYPDRFREEAVAPIQNKVGQFISSPLIRNIIGQTKSTINPREVMDEGKILIINLSKGKIGEDASQLLGALIITKIQLAAMSRVNVPEEQRRDFHLYVDEFQNFATESFTNILSEARKYRLTLILAHQYITQMSEEVRDAVFGNVGSMLVFRVGAADAEFLEKEFQPEFDINDLVNLGFAQIYLKLMIDGMASRPFSASTLPPMVRPETSHREKIVRVSRERYSRSRQEIEEKIAKWSGVAGGPEEEGKGLADKDLFDAVCANCGKKTKITFKPDGVRPIYCRDCLKKVQRGEIKRKPAILVAETPQTGEPVVKESGETASLKDLSKKEQALPVSEPSPKPVKRGKKEVDLSEVRQAVSEALDERKKERQEKPAENSSSIQAGKPADQSAEQPVEPPRTPKSSEAPASPAGGPAGGLAKEGETPKPPDTPKKGTLKPGQSVEL